MVNPFKTYSIQMEESSASKPPSWSATKWLKESNSSTTSHIFIVMWNLIILSWDKEKILTSFTWSILVSRNATFKEMAHISPTKTTKTWLVRPDTLHWTHISELNREEGTISKALGMFFCILCVGICRGRIWRQTTRRRSMRR